MEDKAENLESRRSARKWISARMLAGEKLYVQDQAKKAGLSLSEYARRRILGGRPVIAQTDIATIAELRRQGGLLKHNFAILRQTGVTPEILASMENTLRALRDAADRIGVR